VLGVVGSPVSLDPQFAPQVARSGVRGVPLTKKSGQSKPSKKAAKPASRQPVGKPTAKPAPKPAPKPVTKASSKPASKPTARATSKAGSPKAPSSKPTAKVGAAAVRKPIPAKDSSKSPAKVAPKAPAKIDPKAIGGKSAAKAPAKSAVAVKPAPKFVPEAKATAKSPATPGKTAAPTKPGAAKAGPAVPATPAERSTPPAEHSTSNRKGITVVTAKPQGPKKPVPKKNISADIAALAGQLLGGGSVRRPLISSGPNAPSLRPLGLQSAAEEAPAKVVGKTPFGKKDLERFRLMLVRKRAELLGDITTLEQEALRGESGSLSNLPQHMAEQGSEAYEQSLQLDLAAQDRKLLKEIDDAISRIDAGTYGVCEVTGKPIKPERLEELPWARYTIEAQRELERRSMRT